MYLFPLYNWYKIELTVTLPEEECRARLTSCGESTDPDRFTAPLAVVVCVGSGLKIGCNIF